MKVGKVQAVAAVSLACLVTMGFGTLIVLRLFFFNYAVLPQDGMYPGMPIGSRFITRRNPYNSIQEIKRGDIVVFNKVVGGSNSKYVWRVVGLPGDLVEVSNESVRLNGQVLRHDPVRQEGEFLIVREWNGDVSYEVAYTRMLDRAEPPPIASIRVPNDHLFVLGDNRYMAEDSTFIGPIPFASVIEKKVF